MNEPTIRCILYKSIPFKSFINTLKPDFSVLKVIYENDGSNGLDMYGYLAIHHNKADHHIFFSQIHRNHIDSSICISGDITLVFIADASDDILTIFSIFSDHFGGFILDDRHSSAYIEYIPKVLSLEL